MTELQRLQQQLNDCQQQLNDCHSKNEALHGQAARQQFLLQAATSERGQLEEQLRLQRQLEEQLRGQLESERRTKRQHDDENAAAFGELRQQLASCENQLRQRNSELQGCLAELAKRQEADKQRRSSGGSHAAGDQPPLQPPQQQHQQQHGQAGLLAGTAAEAGAGRGGAPMAGEPAALASGEVRAECAQCLGWRFASKHSLAMFGLHLCAGAAAPAAAGGFGVHEPAPSSTLGEGRVALGGCAEAQRG